jgi:hypothetical protein
MINAEAYYFDPKDLDSIKKSMISAIEAPKKQPIIEHSFEQELQILEKIFLDSIPVRKTWGQFDQIH